MHKLHFLINLENKNVLYVVKVKKQLKSQVFFSLISWMTDSIHLKAMILTYREI